MEAWPVYNENKAGKNDRVTRIHLTLENILQK
jgi:hypothetical protein